MPTQDAILEAQLLIGRLWKEKQSPERARILECTGYTLSFISATGQDYRFEDFRQSHVPGSPRQAGTGSANLRELLARTQGFFNQLLADPGTSNEQGPLRIILDAVEYIVSTGGLDALGEHMRRLEAGSPPHVVAAFGTREEAAVWLEQVPEPPSRALVLIDDQYHQAVYLRDINHRKVIPWPAMEYYLAELVQDVAPVAMASFTNRESAEAWLEAQTEPPDRAWVLIAGEFHLAVNHANVRRRALYPLSMADGYAVNDEVEAERPQQD
ncbi:hypothetical protein [Vitiosangium sp. GDMCC 1.1324]|uniref:hypothetical protein n=1 Tax=Vitiosangium sp. (strain GDMCC 1.1324) TaxID=2138576 RepID=UPI000D39C1FC|nr:hypothetical protein [Vitiosangium sp. GDMCC 1.1324]PTL83889.1 hypothetical protein DAT35_10530 [Vitiosangium sp. GDMCC 1.1324]